jgi:hypothetical protein
MTAQTPLQSKELYDTQAPVKPFFVAHTETVAALAPLGATKLVNIGNAATGTEIATAVNGILAILITAGLMKAS